MSDGLYRGEARYRNHKDPLSAFRYFLGRAVSRTDKLGTSDLTPEYLQELWKLQQAICPLTGWALYLPVSSNGFSEKSPRNASLDRIDNSKGYLVGNVRFVALMANIARSDFTDAEIVEFCHAVAGRHGLDNLD